MCGRYAVQADLDSLAKRFGAELSMGEWSWEPQFNICPTQVVPAVAQGSSGDRMLVPMRWGLHPHWSKDSPSETKYGPFFNARVETASTKASFRTPWKRRRALIPATHWYEWTGEQGGKVPWCVKPETTTEDGLFALAGLWDRWRVDEGIELLSCTILTTEAKGPITRLHHRMPVRLPEDNWDAWLDPEANPDMIMETQQDGEDLIFWEVGRAVNNARSSGPDLINPAV